MELYSPSDIAKNYVSTSSVTVKKIGFIGLGAMGFGMAAHLVKLNFSVIGYDVILFLFSLIYLFKRLLLIHLNLLTLENVSDDLSCNVNIVCSPFQVLHLS